MKKQLIKIPEQLEVKQQKRRVFARIANSHPLKAMELYNETEDNVLKLDIYDEIGFWGIQAKAVRDILHKKTKPYSRIDVSINSPGGDVFDGIAIFNDLYNYPAPVHVTVTGVAASAASIIAMAGDKITISENAFVMIHNAWGVSIGNKHDMTDMVDILTKIDESIAKTYLARTDKLNLEEIVQMMDDETWLNAEDAEKYGFVDSIDEINNKTEFCFDLTVFDNVPSEVKQRIETTLRDAGYSQREAKMAIAKGFSSLPQRDVEKDDPKQRDVVEGDTTGLLDSIVDLTKKLNSST